MREDGPSDAFARRFAGWAALAGVIVLGAALRFQGLGSESLWLDEGFTLAMARQTLGENLRESLRDVHSVPYFQIVRGSIRLLGESEESLRLPSALAGSLLPAAVFFLARGTIPPWAALPAALLTTLASYQIRYSQEARQYSLLALLATLSMLAFVRLLRARGRDEPLRSPSRRLVTTYVAVSLLALAIHHHAIFVIGAQVLTVLAARRSLPREARTRLRAAYLLLIPFLAGWAVLSVVQWRAIGGFATVERASLSAIAKTATLFLVPDFERSAVESWILAALVLTAFLPAGRRLLRHPPSEAWATAVPGPILLLGAWLFASLVLPVVVSWLGFPVFRKRYAISAGVPLYLLFAWGLAVYPSRRRPWVVATVAALLLGSHLAARAEGPRKEDWRSAGAFLGERAACCDSILLDDWEYRFALGFYLPPDLRARLEPVATALAPAGTCLVLGPIRSDATASRIEPWVGRDREDGRIEHATFRGPIEIFLPLAPARMSLLRAATVGGSMLIEERPRPRREALGG